MGPAYTYDNKAKALSFLLKIFSDWRSLAEVLLWRFQMISNNESNARLIWMKITTPAHWIVYNFNSDGMKLSVIFMYLGDSLSNNYISNSTIYRFNVNELFMTFTLQIYHLIISQYWLSWRNEISFFLFYQIVLLKDSNTTSQTHYSWI